MGERTSYEIGIDRDQKIREKIAADQLHKDLKQALISVQYDIAKWHVRQRTAEARRVMERDNLDLVKEINQCRLEVAILRVQQKEIDGRLNQSRFNIKKITDEAEILRGQFFSAKESGI